MKVREQDIEIKGFIAVPSGEKRVKKVVYKLKNSKVLRFLDIDIDKEYTEDELKKLICEVMQNEQ